MAIKIPDLLEVVSMDRVTEVLMDAFTDYPKLMSAFPQEYGRRNALEASIRYYGQYDMYYGKAYTLDEEVFEVVLMLESKNVKVSKSKCLKAGCYSYEYQEVKERMPVEDRKKRLNLFRELEKLEKKVPVPRDYLYIDFLGVVKEKRGEGRGSRLMEKICEYADSVKLPIVLFTNTDEAKQFYEKFGFTEIMTVTSEKFGFENTYIVRNPEST